MTRRSWTAKRRLALFEAHGGICHLCGGKIDGTREPWEVEHLIPVAMGGEDGEANCAPAHVTCHKVKTKTDVATIAKANRIRAKHNGARPKPRNPMPGTKGSKWKAKVGGGWERRDA